MWRHTLLLMFASLAWGAQDHPILPIGSVAPDFTLPGTDGKTYRLNELKGHWVVLGWFPKAFTGG